MKYYIRLIVLMSIIIPTIILHQNCNANGEMKSNKTYPLIKTIDTTFTFLDAKKAIIELYLKGLDGKDLYCLKCVDYWHVDSYEDNNYSFSGDFDCYLRSLDGNDPVSTLFTENHHPTSDWDSTRARFFSSQLIGDCGDYPDYGKIRTFNLRGMQIILSIKNIVFSLDTIMTNNYGLYEDYNLNSFTFQIICLPNPSNKTIITETSKFIKPNAFDRPYLKGDSSGCSEIKMLDNNK